MFKNKTTNLIHWKRSSDVDFEYMLVLTKNTSENAHKQFHSGIIRNQITYETVFPESG